MSAGHAERIWNVINTLFAAWAHLETLIGVPAELIRLSMVKCHLVAGWELLNKVQFGKLHLFGLVDHVSGWIHDLFKL